jgi:23S rRNA pseudouridine955/2504/2580 synthase
MNGLGKGLSAPAAVRTVVVGGECAGQRVDNFLARELKGVPRSHLYRIVRSGEVRVNGRRVEASCKLAEGDRVRLPPVRTAARSEVAPLPVEVPVLFEDAALVALDKPAGLAVHGGSGVSFGLIERLRAARPEAKFLELVHRLDRETSGVLLVAKKRAALVELHAALREGRTGKRYLALVLGDWPARRQDIRLSLRKLVTPGGERRVRVDEDEGLASHSVVRPMRAWKRADPPQSLVEVELRTGRTHQIRVHLSHLGHPIAGDDKYGDFDWNRELSRHGLKRMFLHAAVLDFPHPLTGERVRVESPLPADLERYVGSLDAAAEGAGESAG